MCLMARTDVSARTRNRAHILCIRPHRSVLHGDRDKDPTPLRAIARLPAARSKAEPNDPAYGGEVGESTYTLDGTAPLRMDTIGVTAVHVVPGQPPNEHKKSVGLTWDATHMIASMSIISEFEIYMRVSGSRRCGMWNNCRNLELMFVIGLNKQRCGHICVMHDSEFARSVAALKTNNSFHVPPEWAGHLAGARFALRCWLCSASADVVM